MGKEYLFFGYGSLVSHNSLKETINDRQFTPAFIKGYKRVFNLIERNKDFLNLKKSSSHEVNGVLFKVNDKELDNIMKREYEYNLEETNVYDFITKKKIGKALIVIDYLVNLDKKKAFPNKNYFTLCREAAYHLGLEFGKFWDENTYTSKNQRISNWLKNNKKYDTIDKNGFKGNLL